MSLPPRVDRGDMCEIDHHESTSSSRISLVDSRKVLPHRDLLPLNNATQVTSKALGIHLHTGMRCTADVYIMQSSLQTEDINTSVPTGTQGPDSPLAHHQKFE